MEQKRTAPFRLSPLARQGWSALLALTVALFSMLASSHLLHEAIHSDASSPTHQCAISLFQQNNVLSSDNAAPLIVVADAVFHIAPLPQTILPPTSDFVLLPTRGPPGSLVG